MGGGRLLDPPRFPEHITSLHQALARTRARLVVLDPIVSFLGRHLVSSNDQCVRQTLAPLGALAAHHQCAMILVRHLNKSGGLRWLYRGSGSIGFIGACRSAWLVAPDPHESSRRVLAQVKGSLAELQPSLAYTLAADAAGALRVDWQGPSPWSADQLLTEGAALGPAKPRPREQAARLLEEFLSGGPRTSNEVWAFAQQHKLAERTVRRAKDDLHIISRRVYMDGDRISYWLLPAQELPPHIPPEAVEVDFLGLLGRQPGAAQGNPLDSL